MSKIMFTSEDSFDCDLTDEVKVKLTMEVEGDVLTHTDVTNFYVDFLRGCGYVLSELSTDRFS